MLKSLPFYFIIKEVLIMILCVDIKSLKESSEVQRDVNLGDLINNHTKYFDSVEDALKENYVPLDFSVTVRSMYSNQVLQINKGEEKRYYVNLTNIQPFIHKGYDLVMYLSSIGIMHSIDYSLGFDELMLKHSQFCPIGIYNSVPLLVNPIVYSHILMSDEGMEELKKYLKEDRDIVPIGIMKESSKGNIKALLDTIIEVKEEDKNE